MRSRPWTILPYGFLRMLSTSQSNRIKVGIVGASGGVGMPMSLLLKMNPLVSHLSLIDVVSHTLGVADDLAHISTPCKVKGYKAPEDLHKSLHGCDIVMICAGLPRKYGLLADDLFNSNAVILRDITFAISESCPKAFIGVITDPVNSLVPLVNEVMERAGKSNPNRVFGVTSLDVVRSKTFIGLAKGLNPMTLEIPVIGGQAENTIVPLISRIKPEIEFTEGEIKQLTKRIQEAGSQVVKMKEGTGAATLSMAYAAARMTSILIRGLMGEDHIIECAYVKSDLRLSKYLTMPVLIGKEGIKKRYDLGTMSEFEQDLLNEAIKILKKNISRGERFGLP